MFDKTVADLQENVVIGTSSITGTSKYLADWSSAGFDPTKGTNFVAIHAEAGTGSTVYAKVDPSQGGGWVEGDSSGDFVFQIKDTTESIMVKAIKGQSINELTYELDLTLAGE